MSDEIEKLFIQDKPYSFGGQYRLYNNFTNKKKVDEALSKSDTYTRFLQHKKEYPELNKQETVIASCQKMMLPILYTVLTTICAFLSLIFSGIKPIIDFGWMMTLGLVVSFFVTFTLLPSLLNIISIDNEINVKDTEKSIITSFLGFIAKKNSFIIRRNSFFIRD